MIYYNQVYQYVDKEGENRIRVISIDSAILYYVDLHGGTAMPKKATIEDMEIEIESNVLIPISDPFLKSYAEEDLTEKQLERRNLNWEIVFKAWSQSKESILSKKNRKTAFLEIAEEHQITELKVKRLFTRFWQRGLNKNAMLPDYMHSGGKGKVRELSQEKKVGRPRIYGEEEQGINITEDVKKQFRHVIKKYYRKSEKLTLNDTYQYLLKEFYSNKYHEGESVKYKVWDKSKVPTYNQFYYWYKKTEEPQLDIQLRYSKKEYELKHRPILSHSALETDGPGTRFQVDATIADIYLVSSFDRNLIIGRPVIYGIMDVYSRLITGVYVGLEGPSWIGAMMTLDNMTMDKVEFCKQYDIDIDESEWPAHHLPETIIADRGEFEGYGVEQLINNLNVKIENTSPYRGDLKGIVERQFRTINEKIKRKAPGAIQKEFRERGDRDYRLDASLNLEEFTKIIIHLVLNHNQRTIEKYPLEKAMIKEHLTPSPLNLWKWGLSNRKGSLQTVQNRSILRLNLLPKGKARITRAGIKFKGLSYGSDKALNDQWYLKRKSERIDVVYDPRSMDKIYIPYIDGRGFDTCYLLEMSSQYRGESLEEIEFYQQMLQELKQAESLKQREERLNTDEEIESIIKKAVKQKKANANVSATKGEKIKDIRVNKKAEKAMNRQKESFDLNQNKKESPAQVVSIEKENEEVEQSKTSSSLMEKLRKKRDEEFGKDQ